MGMLKKAGFIDVRPGVGGASLLKSPEDITLLDIYRAVHVVDDNRLFRFHEEPNVRCPVGRNIEAALQSEMNEAQLALENRLAETTLSGITSKFI
jgi:DNA-binding IscR family transcriptional regulator